MNEIWGIVGLGWLGAELAKHLPNSWGTHRSTFDFTKDELPGAPCDVLFLNTPPLTALSPHEYVRKVSSADAERVIFISSTSVYGETQGRVDEATPPAPEATGAQWLWAVEQELQSRLGLRLQVIRPGGLIGGDRHPARTLAGRQQIKGGLSPINLIHRDDLIQLILHHSHRPLLNAVAPVHPTKSTFYTEWAKHLGLPIPHFTDDGSGSKEVHSLFLESFQWAHRLRAT